MASPCPSVMKPIRAFMVLLFVRLSSVYLVRTWYVPDEYWQSLEVAHRLVFGYGHLTWEWDRGIRSYIYPGLIALLYKILAYWDLDTVENLVLLPRIFQAILSTFADFCFFLWYRRETGNLGVWALFNVSISWFHFYTATRTLTNSVETSLTSIALYYYPWKQNVKGIKYRSSFFLWFVGLACVFRPTMAVVWIPLCIHHIVVSQHRGYVIIAYCKKVLIILIASSLIDSLFYGRLICPSVNFIHENVFKNIASFYGEHPAMWYAYTGLPGILGMHFVPFCMGCLRIFGRGWVAGKKVQQLLLYAIVWTVSVYSVVPHKEFRFILPLVPMALFITSSWLSYYCPSYSRNKTRFLLVSAALIVGSVVPCLYFGLVHQRGTIDVMTVLAKEAAKNVSNTDIFFVMPCHSTPFYSHLHVNVSATFLECNPYDSFDEAEIFYKNPLLWISSHFPHNAKPPSHIVLFDCLHGELLPFLRDRRFILIANLFHTQFPEGRVGRNVMVFKKFHI